MRAEAALYSGGTALKQTLLCYVCRVRLDRQKVKVPL